MANSKSPMARAKMASYIFVLVSIYPFEGVLDRNASAVDSYIQQCVADARAPGKTPGICALAALGVIFGRLWRQWRLGKKTRRSAALACVCVRTLVCRLFGGGRCLLVAVLLSFRPFRRHATEVTGAFGGARVGCLAVGALRLRGPTSEVVKQPAPIAARGVGVDAGVQG